VRRVRCRPADRMNAVQVIASWWDNFSRSSVGQFCLLVFFALGLGERNGEHSERRLALAAQRRTRGVGRAGIPGARNAVTVGDGGTKPSERSATGGVRDGMSEAHDAGVKRSGPRDCIRGGLVALTPQGEPAVSWSEGPCGPSGATSGRVTEGRSRAERDTDPLPSSAAVEVVAGAQGRSGVPTGLSTPDAIARATERTGARPVAPQAPKPVGLDTTGRKEQQRLKEDAGCVTALLARSVPLDH